MGGICEYLKGSFKKKCYIIDFNNFCDIIFLKKKLYEKLGNFKEYVLFWIIVNKKFLGIWC